eukprot:NODE_59_length_3614_cov_19.415989_g52_i0.p1 GENE.NODE_59_length_3614_cov_19.415989_g52_i0~~NODE_59_length_3614_cov_19.415989_g52_i0.p1  ORF type:complete len:1122 (-),score=277.24 NODE_59_length_3614_cov_19.415989_g52_i0:77-3442(-)
MRLERGAHVWFNSPKVSWTQGTVTEVSGDEKKVVYACRGQDDDELFQGLLERDVHQFRPESLTEDVNDLLHLTELHESSLFNCVKKRYMNDIVYTNIGSIVVALNPFNFKIPHYQDDKMAEYMKEGEIIEKNLPHSWAVAHNAYHAMLNNQQNQCVIITGESGAGKTEATKIVQKYLCEVSCVKGDEKQKEQAKLVGFRIQQASPILEAFGNAKTVRNDNSSRFGKFMKVQFAKSGMLVGSSTVRYLLEKSRIITAGPEERVYHAFYQLTAGSEASRFNLLAQKEHVSLGKGGVYKIKGVDDAECFKETAQAMLDVGIEPLEQDAVWRLLAGILFLQNVAFKGEEKCIVSTDGKSTSSLAAAAQQLAVPLEGLEKELITTTQKVRGEDVVKNLGEVAAAAGRDALTKALYEGLFGWLVDKVNEKTAGDDACTQWIGLLDIFGFENFAVNSFEQLCINLTNETLQNHYNAFIFEKDVEECRAERIDVTKVSFDDNTACVDVISGKGGILALLDDQCALGKGTDAGFLNDVNEAHAKHPHFAKQRVRGSSFAIRHYAGTVEYATDGFLEKNKDTLKLSMRVFIRAEGSDFIRLLIAEPPSTRGRAPTVSSFFKNQLKDLMCVLNSSNPHWIRCIKPHPAKQPKMFDGVSVMTQMRSAGILETVRIRSQGFPVRIPVEKFGQKFSLIIGEAGVGGNALGNAQRILKEAAISSEQAQVGLTKVFLRHEGYTRLLAEYERYCSVLVLRIQCLARGHSGRLIAARMWFKRFEEVLELQRKLRKQQTELLAQEAKIREEQTQAVQAEWERIIASERALRREVELVRLNRMATRIQRRVRGFLDRGIVLLLKAEIARAEEEYLAQECLAEARKAMRAWIEERRKWEKGEKERARAAAWKEQQKSSEERRLNEKARLAERERLKAQQREAEKEREKEEVRKHRIAADRRAREESRQNKEQALQKSPAVGSGCRQKGKGETGFLSQLDPISLHFKVQAGPWRPFAGTKRLQQQLWGLWHRGKRCVSGWRSRLRSNCSQIHLARSPRSRSTAACHAGAKPSSPVKGKLIRLTTGTLRIGVPQSIDSQWNALTILERLLPSLSAAIITFLELRTHLQTQLCVDPKFARRRERF